MTIHKIDVAHQPIFKQKFNWLLAVGIFILGLGLGAFVTTLPIVKTELSEQNAAGPIGRDFPARPDLAELERAAIEAEAARYTHMAEFYLDQAKAQRAIEAEAARYSGLAEFYLSENAAKRQRALEAEAARYAGLAKFFMAGE